jgi:hypothetical protein
VLYFVSEPSLDLGGSGSASFAVGIATIRCASLPEAIELSRRLRAVLMTLARRGVRPRRKPGGLAAVADWATWIDDLEHGVSLPADARSPSSFASAASVARDDFEAPK